MVTPTSNHRKNSNSPAVVVSAGARSLQERLHALLSRLASTVDQVKNWKEASGDDASIHVESTSRLIANIRQILACIQKVEGQLQIDPDLYQSLQQCQIPLDLLDLMDASHLNPDCFARGLLREALGQLAGLKRRKLALELLGAAVQSGIQKKKQLASSESKTSTKPAIVKESGVKREREDEAAAISEPPTKKAAVEKSPSATAS